MMSVRDVHEISKEPQACSTLFFIFVCKRYFVPPAVIKAVVVSFLDRLVFLHLLERIWGWFAINEAHNIICSAWRWIRNYSSSLVYSAFEGDGLVVVTRWRLENLETKADAVTTIT